MRAESLGEQGRRWMAALNGLVDGLANDWRLRLGGSLRGGSESLVLSVVMEGNQPAVLKLGLPGPSNIARESSVLKLAGPGGYARLYRADVKLNAMLVEALGEPLRKAGLSVERQMKVICETLEKAWTPLAGPHEYMTGEGKLDWLENFIREKWPALGKPCQEPAIHQAYDFISDRKDAFDPGDCVLVHGDAHADNTLRSAEGGYKFIDPDGLFAEKACDLAAIMRDWNEELLAGRALAQARARSELLAEATDVDERAIWQWGSIERISTGLALLDMGMGREAAAFLEAADQLAARKL